ncbi:Pfam:RanBPM CRA [Geosmithia morbida]|uniref:Pfam:RanBPM CRA n=1 Tax=Geosmithia morbida TaxID=1094350 RepID=A0A9P4Z0D8_9HYPO|nr:Pfam:RanBPM CRA [Geosmithia morbida]KAF4125380.1 Pfam:RanBPM CRA [Geosmithia morbida]
MSSSSTTTPAKHDWERRVWEAKPPKSDINALIMHYFNVEGYPKAAANFAREANLPDRDEEDFLQARWDIRDHIYNGRFEAAIEALNDINPSILEEDEGLHFLLLRLQLIELIRSCSAPDGDVSQAIQFATEHLGPRAPANPQFLEDLELTMALLMIPHDSLEPQLAALLDPALRQDAAEKVNSAIMANRSLQTASGLRTLLRMRCYTENRAREYGIPIPPKLDIGLRSEDNDGSNNDTPEVVMTV